MTELYSPNSSEKPKINVEYLKGYATLVDGHLEVCEQTLEKIQHVIAEIKEKLPEAVNIVEEFENKFSSKNNLFTPAESRKVVGEVKTEGVTTDPEVQRHFKQIESDEERAKEFKDFVIMGLMRREELPEGLKLYQTQAGIMLILLEELKNIHRFIDKGQEPISSVREAAESMIKEIVDSANKMGVEYRHIPLFEKFDNYLGKIQDCEIEVDPVYKNVSGLHKGDILQVHSVGLKSPYTSWGEEESVVSLV